LAKFIAKKFIYQQNFGATDKANKVHSSYPTQKISPGVRKVLMEYCRKFCRKAHANKKQTQKQKHPTTHTLVWIEKNRQTKTFKEEIQHQKMGIKFLFLLLFYAAVAVCWLFI